MRPRFAFLLLPVFAAFLFVACQGEGEGQPCDTNAGNAGNDDCQPPLVCTTGLTNANSPRCCPQNRANATTPECSLTSSTVLDASPAPPTEASTEASTETSTSDAATDGPTEGATEAGMAGDASDGATSPEATPEAAAGD